MEEVFNPVYSYKAHKGCQIKDKYNSKKVTVAQRHWNTEDRIMRFSCWEVAPEMNL